MFCYMYIYKKNSNVTLKTLFVIYMNFVIRCEFLKCKNDEYLIMINE